MPTSKDSSLKKVSRTKSKDLGSQSKSRSNSLKGLRKSLKSLRKSLKSHSKSRSKSRSKSLRSMSPTWSAKHSECPKTPLHQLTVDRHKSNWIKLNVTRDVKKKKNKYIINKLKKLPGIYMIIILKEDPSILYLLREFKDLYYNGEIEYPEAPMDDGRIGHSSVFTKSEFTIEWLKEETARKYDLDASKESDPIKKKKLRRTARRTREQCLLYFAGQLYYDKELVVWTNHSGHFQTKDYVKHKVGLPLDKYAPMSSKKIHTMIDQRYA